MGGGGRVDSDKAGRGLNLKDSSRGFFLLNVIKILLPLPAFMLPLSHTNTPPSPVPHRGVRGIVSTEPLVYSLPFYYLESTNVLRERQLQICSACGSGTSPPLFPLRLFGGKEEGGEVPLMPLEACCQSPENNHFSVITQAFHLNRNHYRESFVYTRSSEVCTPRQPRAHIYEICRFANIKARFSNCNMNPINL